VTQGEQGCCCWPLAERAPCPYLPQWTPQVHAGSLATAAAAWGSSHTQEHAGEFPASFE